MKSLQTVITLGAAIGLCACQASAGETELAFDKLPGKIQSAMREVVGKGKIIKTTKETEPDGRVIYEVAYAVGDRKFEAEVSSQGKLLVVDEEISLSKAPAAVRKAIEEATAGGKIVKLEKATQGKEVFYEAEFTKGGKEHEVKVDPRGKVIGQE